MKHFPKTCLQTLALAGVLCASGSANAQPTLVTAVPLPANMSGVAVNPVLNKIYVSGGLNGSPNTVVLDGTTFGQIGGGVGWGDSVDVVNNNYWAATVYSGTAIVRSGITDGTLANVSLGFCPMVTAVDAPHRRTWVGAQCGGDMIWAINADSYGVIAGPLSTGGTMSSVQVNPATGRAYVYTSAGPMRVNPPVYVLTTTTFGPVVAANEAANLLYAVGAGGTLQIFNGAPDPEVFVANGALAFPVAGGTVGVNSTLNRLYVGQSTNVLAVLNATTGQAISSVPLGAAVTGIANVAVDASRSRVYVMAYSGAAPYLYVLQDSAPPVLASFSPILGTPGTLVTLTGSGLAGATVVSFNGTSCVFSNVSGTQINAIVPADATSGPISVTTPAGTAVSSNNFTAFPAGSSFIGPVFPPPGPYSFIPSGTPSDGTIGRVSGKTWYFQNISLANASMVFWGATNRSVALSFDDSVYSEPPATPYSEILTYQPSLSSLSGGVVVWTGETRLPGNSTPVYTKFTLTMRDGSSAPLPLLDAPSVGLPPNVGGVLRVTPGLYFVANLRFDASGSASGPWTPALDFYDAQTLAAGTAFSSFAGGFYYENTPPVIAGLSNQLANAVSSAGTQVGPYAFSLSDVQTAQGGLLVWATSTNQTLISDFNILVDRWGGADASVRLYPNPNQAGTSLITIYAADDYATNSSSFLLTLNAAPTISPIFDKKTNKNTPSGPHAFTLGDLETPPDLLTLTAVSTNTTLVPNTNIVFSGSGSNRSVTITPAPDQIGPTAITLTVSDGLASASTTFGLLVNDPPQLIRNDPLNLLQGAATLINSSLLQAADVESPASQLTFTIASGSSGGTTRAGALQLFGTNLLAGNMFTQDDLDNNRLTYVQSGSCDTNDDFQFNVADPDGGVTPTGIYSTYTFHINITHSNHPPVALNGSAMFPLGATMAGQFSALDTDCPPFSLTFSILTNGVRSTATLTNANTGGFLYTANPGQTGTDTLVFQVSDGMTNALVAGNFTLTITNQPPTPVNGLGTTWENVPLAGFLSATDFDLPQQTLSFSIAANASRGTATVTNAATGGFIYTPNSNAIGTDSFEFSVSDGFLSSTGSFTVTIRPNLDAGDIIVSDGGGKSLVLIDESGTQFVLSSGGQIINPVGVALEPSGTIVLMDTTSGLLRINPTNGAQILVASATNFSTGPIGPAGIAVESDGAILVADGVNGLIRVNPVSGEKSVLSSGGSMYLPEGVTVAPSGEIYVADVSAFLGQPSRILRVDPANGAQTVVSSGGKLTAPIGVAVDSHGAIVVSDAATFAGGSDDSVLQIDPVGGGQTIIATNTLLHLPTGLALAAGNRVLTANNGAGTLVQINRTTGAQSVLASGGALVKPFGLAVVHRLVLHAPTVLPGRQFRFLVEGEPGETYLIQNSEDLLTWNLLGYVTNVTAMAQFTTDMPSTPPRQFYRALAP